MSLIWKDVLYAGRVPEPGGGWATIAPRDIVDAEQNARRALARGVNVPLVWEHQLVEARDVPIDPARRAVWLRRYTGAVFGHVANVKRTSEGVLWLALAVPGSGDVEQLAKCRFVSPKLYRGYADATGARYDGLFVAHVAATPHPVQVQQRPFEVPERDEEAAARKLVTELVRELGRRGVRLPPGSDLVSDLRHLVILLKCNR